MGGGSSKDAYKPNLDHLTPEERAAYDRAVKADNLKWSGQWWVMLFFPFMRTAFEIRDCVDGACADKRHEREKAQQTITLFYIIIGVGGFASVFILYMLFF